MEVNMNSQTTSKNEKSDQPAIMSTLDFARLGDGHLAYIRQLKSGEAGALFPNLQGIPEGINLYALVSADGTPLSLSDSRNGAVADAMQNDLETVSLH